MVVTNSSGHLIGMLTEYRTQNPFAFLRVISATNFNMRSCFSGFIHIEMTKK